MVGRRFRTRTYDLRIMRCTFRRAATWIQQLAVGPSDLKWDQMSSIGAELATLVATRKYDDLNPDPLVPDQIQAIGELHWPYRITRNGRLLVSVPLGVITVT